MSGVDSQLHDLISKLALCTDQYNFHSFKSFNLGCFLSFSDRRTSS
jgi:hypothetical protein